MMNKDTAYKIIEELVDRFEEQLPSYKKSEYNEYQTRKDFIDPFFKALGWDMDNSQGHAEAYREVINEDRVKVGGATKAPENLSTPCSNSISKNNPLPCPINYNYWNNVSLIRMLPLIKKCINCTI